MVEFALLSPLLLMMVLLTIDFGRLVYTYGAIGWAAREGARMASLEPQKSSDCPIYQRVLQVAQGFNLGPDPNSLVNDSNPNTPAPPLQPTTPPPGQGYVYVFPAVAPTTPQYPTNCNGDPRANSKTFPVAVQIQYTYLPLVPWFSDFMPITLRSISVVATEY